MAIFKSEELIASLGVTVEITQDILVDTVDTANALILTASENKSTVAKIALGAVCANDALNNGIGVVNGLGVAYGVYTAITQKDKLTKDYKKNQDKVKQMAKEIIDNLDLEEDEDEE